MDNDFGMVQLTSMVDIDTPIDDNDWHLLMKVAAEITSGAEGVIALAGLEMMAIGVAGSLKAAYLLGKRHGGLVLMVAPEVGTGANVSNN